VLLVCPPPLGRVGQFEVEFRGAEETSRALAGEYARVAAARSCAVLDAGAHASASDIDGIHLDRAAHAALGVAIADAVPNILASV
jgi:hypothetical protein